MRAWAHWFHSLGLRFPLTKAALPACLYPATPTGGQILATVFSWALVWFSSPRPASPPGLLPVTERRPRPERWMHLGPGPAPSCPGVQQARRKLLKNPPWALSSPGSCAHAKSL